MTEIDELQVGSELDALIAKRVMGWIKTEWDGVYYWRDPAIDDSHTGNVADERSTAGYLLEDLSPWSPSADIAAAWEVVEKLHEFSSFIEIKRDDYGWSCMIGRGGLRNGKWEWEPYSNAKTAPLAICRAALKQVEDANIHRTT